MVNIKIDTIAGICKNLYKKLAKLRGSRIDEGVGPVRLAVRTQDFHSCNRGSIPLRDAIYNVVAGC